MSRRIPIAAAVLFAALCGLAWSEQQCSGKSLRAVSDFTPLADGAQLLDKKTQLIWMRCIEDQSWTGSTCQANDPLMPNPGPRVTYAQAKALAAAASKPKEAWRIPTKKELLTLREPGCYNPSMSLELFPSQPPWSSDGAFWSSTPEAEGVALVSAIGSSDSWSTTEASKTEHLRLVRSVSKEVP